MASTSNTSTHPQPQDFAPSTSTSTSAVSNFKMRQYKPPLKKFALLRDKKYHVFLSFRGKDVRRTFVHQLYEALSAAGLHVFLDSEKLEKGKNINALFEEIKRSAIHVPIFSRGYADSVWCLKEAAAILSTSKLIIPLFYRVEPKYVRYPRNEKSPYNKSFEDHYGHIPDRNTKKEVESWKNALEKISDLSGWSMDITESYEAPLVKTVVNDLIKTLDRRPFEVAKHPVGMGSVKNEVIQKLNLESREGKVVKVGIWGIGGIGKTTVAKAVYNEVYADFEAASFVFNVRATAADPTGLTNLQKQILEDLIKYDGKVHSVEHGISLFIDRLGGKRVLLILDDVDAIVQLNALVGDWLFSGSRVIITSRDKHILNVAQISSIHEMSELKIDEGLQLFSLHAFRRASPSLKYKKLSTEIAEACEGHPLSLEVLGSLLYDKQNDTGCWTEALHNITLHPDILKRLYISYGALSDDEKEIFVDIACFFVEEHKRFPILFWKSLYEMVDTSLCNLSDKLLIEIDDKGVFQMHKHLRYMGRNIVKKEKEGSRLWEAPDLSIVSNKNKFSRLQLNGVNPQKLQMLCTLGLRYLHLKNLPIEGMAEDTLGTLPPSLIWLRLENCHGVNSSFIPSLFSIPNIRLQHLDLVGCINLNVLPDTIDNLSQLERLNFKGCVNLNRLPETFCNLSQLHHLDLEGCESLSSLPNDVGRLSKLQHLNLKGCIGLVYLPNTIRDLSKLQHLDLFECINIEHPPNMRGLLELQFYRWKNGQPIMYGHFFNFGQ